MASPATAACADPAFEYARLDNPGVATVIRSMNSTNEVAGAFQTNPRKASSALIFLANHGVEDVAGEQGAGSSVAYGINDQGEIAGAYNTSTAQRPFRAVRRLGFQELALPPGSNGGLAYAINEIGEAAGYVSGTTGIRPVWWNRRGEVQLLQSPGNLTAQALDLNDRGDIVGVSGGEPKAAVLWPKKGGIVSLGTLPGFTHSEAVAISENGTIAGVATGVGEFPNRSRAVLWQAGGLAIQDLGALPGGTDSRARDVNNRGEVVGISTSAEGTRAFIWTASSGMRDLNTLVNVPGLVMTEALSVNKQGDIVVSGHDAATDAHGEAEAHGHEDHHAARRIFVLRPLQ
jgi:probable HAF family extracellular repeat protein